MRKLIAIMTGTLLLLSLSIQSKSQAIDDDGTATYIKKNIVLTNLKVLGVNTRQYARCVETVNYLDSDKKLRLAEIKGVQFADNGKGNDLVANDGILTSVDLFMYEQGAAIIPPGEYWPVKEDVLIYDPEFAHEDRLNETTTEAILKIKVKCTLEWVKCSSWPAEHQTLCRELSWPFKGGLKPHCYIEFEFGVI